MNIGTDQDFLISNALPEHIKNVDSFAKVNIMTEAHDKLEDNVPQIMFSQTTKDQIKVWNGDRLTMTYTSGNQGGYFGISEVTGSYRNRLNLDFFGENNIFYGTVKGTYDNTFIYAASNRLGVNSHRQSYIHSDNNIVNSTAASSLFFINSDNNYFERNLFNGRYAYVNDVSLYNSNDNTFNPTTAYLGEGNFSRYGELKNISMFASNKNIIKGRTKCTELNEDKFGTTTFINSNSGLYEFNSNQENITMIGNTYGYVTNMRGGNIIGIGQGLIQNGGESDRIILGFYNQNTTDPNEILVVGDGRLNNTYLSTLINDNPDWYKNESTHRRVIRSFSDTGATAKTATHYRHNIFTVNQNGYITISDYRVPSNSARYGYKGITAYVDGKTYDIPFENVYHKINGNDSVDIMQETVDSYTYQIQQKLDSLPISRYETFKDPPGLASNIKTSAYLNITCPEDITGAIQIENLETYNNSILNISYQPNINATNKRLPAILVWSYYRPTPSGYPQQLSVATTQIYPYCSKQFIYCKPAYPLNSKMAKPFSGLTLIEQEVQTNIYLNSNTALVKSNFVIEKVVTATTGNTISFYCGSTGSYDANSWTETDYVDDSVSIFGKMDDATEITGHVPSTEYDELNIVPVIV